MTADKSWLNLRRDPVKLKYRTNWISSIKKYQKVFTQSPESSWAPAGMYRAAQLYFKLYKISLRYEDKTAAIDLLRRIEKRYHSSLYRKRAQQMLRLISIDHRKRNKLSKKYASIKKIIVKTKNTKTYNTKPGHGKKASRKNRHKVIQKNKTVQKKIKTDNDKPSMVSRQKKFLLKNNKHISKNLHDAVVKNTKSKLPVVNAEDKKKIFRGCHCYRT